MRNTLLIGTALLLGSSSAFASQYKDVSTDQYAIFMSDVVASEAEAVALGTQYIKGLNEATPFELSQRLPTPHLKVIKRTFEIDSAAMEVKTDVSADGTLGYFAEVSINYSYDYKGDRAGR